MKEKRRDRRKGLYALHWGYIYMQYVYVCVCVRAYTLHVHVLHIHVKLNFPWGLNTCISSGSWKESDNLCAGGTPKKLAEERRGLLLRLETELEQLYVLPIPETSLLFSHSGHYTCTHIPQWPLLWCAHLHFWMHFLPRGAKAQGVSIFCRLAANHFWRTGFGNQSWQPWSWLFRITGQFEDLSLHCLLRSSVPPAFLYLPGPQKKSKII